MWVEMLKEDVDMGLFPGRGGHQQSLFFVGVSLIVLIAFNKIKGRILIPVAMSSSNF